MSHSHLNVRVNTEIHLQALEIIDSGVFAHWHSYAARLFKYRRCLYNSLIRNSYPLIKFFRQSTFLFEKSRNTDGALRGGAVIQNVALAASAMDYFLGSAAVVAASLLLGSQWSYFLMVIVDKI